VSQLIESKNKLNKIVNSKIEIDLDNCTTCKACISVCPARLFFIESEVLQISDNFEESCIECGHCVAICPVNVISLKFHIGESLKEISIREKITSYESFLSLALTRRSIRQFKNEPVPKELIEKLLEIGRYSPTASNTENVYFTVVKDKTIVSKISSEITKRATSFVKMYENPQERSKLENIMSEEEFKLARDNLPKTKRILKIIEQGIDFWCWNAELISIHGDKEIGSIPENCSLAAAHIMLAAETLGLATCSLGYLTRFSNQSKTIKSLLNIPSNHIVGYTLCIGYPNIKYKRVPARKPLKVEWI
jgi:nitroreductase/NAD-dependent dihydropyrimidine dehydrogenase PreA subunit